MRWWCVCLLLAGLARARAASVFDLMSNNPELSEFLDLVKGDELVSAYIRRAEGTVFAPTNAALQKYKGERSANVLLYHIVNLAMSMEQLTSERSVPTRLKGSQPVFVSVPRPGHVFINNARIVSSDVRATAETQENQVMHIIDEVLEPTIPAEASQSMHFNPNALELLANSNKFSLGNASIGKFYQAVQSNEKLGVFSSGSFNTYFIPVDEKFDAVHDRFTGEVVDGHVIPNHALFTRTMGDESFRTLAFNDMLKATIKLRAERLPAASDSAPASADVASPAAPENLQQPKRFYEAQSTILVGNILLQAGSVLSKVVKPNIAVKNGVVHLIEKPLMVASGDVLSLILEGQHDRFHEFHKLLQRHASDFMVKLMTTSYFTIFIPSNEAFYNVNQRRLKELIATPEALQELLSLHVVSHKVTTESVRKLAQSQPYSVASDAPSRSLYLSLTGDGGLERTLTVEGGGTNATVIIPDIDRSNGVIHIIDRFLGIPYQTVAERLSTDPVASLTSSLARESGFTQQLKSAEKMTLLLPSDIAWQRLKAQLNTSYNAVFADQKSPEVLAVLKRHMIADQALTIEEMANITAANGSVTTTDGETVKVEHMPGSQEYLVKWRSLQARVLRADEECTNGYIHVIDAVLIGPKDISTPRASAASSAAGSTAASALLMAASWSLLRL
ncbi:fasciclin-1-like [Amphibalanus amphitrite]|uniref:fasciclin-1-like n=1 Tax=Amphibalanus amphitrite TaxID=1232801 RepID=UPI001C908965|nr:fasciclin-1-like [Amphibalanus amphitrite]